MKKYLFVLVMMYAQLALAQTWQGRLIDIGFKILEPEDNRYYKLPNTIRVKLRATNYGPDTMCPGDTIYYGFSVGAHSRRLLIYQLNKQLLSGQSVIIEDTLAFKDRPSPPWVYNYGWILFRISGCFARNSSNGPCEFLSPFYDPREGRDSNNFDTSKLYYTNSQSSVDNIHSGVQCYPSPFTRDLTVTAAFDIQHAVIRDLAGREAYRHHAGGKRQLLLQPGPLKTGIYLLELTDIDQRVHTVKIVKDDE